MVRGASAVSGWVAAMNAPNASPSPPLVVPKMWERETKSRKGRLRVVNSRLCKTGIS